MVALSINEHWGKCKPQIVPVMGWMSDEYDDVPNIGHCPEPRISLP